MRIFFRITVPLLAPTIFLVCIVNTISSFKVFSELYPLFKGEAGPFYNLYTVVYYIRYAMMESREYGVAAAEEYLRRGRKQTAAFVTADVLAVGLVKGLLQHGLRIPEDLSVVGFDDVYLSRICYPSLTTVHQDIARKGGEAVRLIMEAAAGARERMECILPLTLVERDSVMERGTR